jgi:hypothetical protein
LVKSANPRLRVEAKALPREVTPVNRMIMGAPGAAVAAATVGLYS